MLVFFDQPNGVKIFRVEADAEGHPGRTRLGVVPKNTLSISGELRRQVSAEELGDIEKMISTYQRARKGRLEQAALSFPELAREALDYYESGADDMERRLIAAAVMEAVRRLRKYERSKQD